METRTFQAREMKEALALVRREFGPSAVILGTRRLPGKALGLLGGSFVEVTAAPSDEPATSPAAASAKPKPGSETDTAPLLASRRAERLRERAPRPVSSLIADNPQSALAAVGPGSVPNHAALRRRLLAALVPRDVCERWLRAIPDLGSTPARRADEEAHLRAHLHSVLGRPAPLVGENARVAALVGPTGVGKTTTVAKLAAHARLVEGKKVALVTMDDQRIGGTTQLRAYAKLLELPVMTVAEAGGLDRALSRHRDADLVVVDTAGVPPTRREQVDQLAQRLHRAGEPVSTHLCIAASTRSEELDRIVHLYAATDPWAILPTKVDEAVAIGSLFTAHNQLSRPFSFLTTGQNVPDDIQPAAAETVIDLLLGGARA